MLPPQERCIYGARCDVRFAAAPCAASTRRWLTQRETEQEREQRAHAPAQEPAGTHRAAQPQTTAPPYQRGATLKTAGAATQRTAGAGEGKKRRRRKRPHRGHMGSAAPTFSRRLTNLGRRHTLAGELADVVLDVLGGVEVLQPLLFQRAEEERTRKKKKKKGEKRKEASHRRSSPLSLPLSFSAKFSTTPCDSACGTATMRAVAGRHCRARPFAVRSPV